MLSILEGGSSAVTEAFLKNRIHESYGHPRLCLSYTFTKVELENIQYISECAFHSLLFEHLAKYVIPNKKR